MRRSIQTWRRNLEKTARLRQQRRRSFTRLHVEALEPRMLLASITLNPISNINEGNSINLSGTYDVGGDSSSMPMLSIDWNGDGTWDQTQFPSGGSFSYSQYYGDDNPTNTPSDNMTVVARISSFSSGSATASTSFTINNVAPSLSMSLSPGTVNPNQSVTLSGSISDPGVSDSHTLRIDWDGNGTWDQTQGAFGSFFVNHSYSTPGTYNVNISLTDDDTGSATGGGTVVVQSNSLSLNIGLSPASINEGGSATLSGSYSGGTSSGMLMLHIDWDNNGTWDQTIYPSGGSFSTSHTWYDDHPSTGTPSDVMNVRAMITDSFSSATASSTITVNNLAPSLNVSFSPGSVNEGQMATLSGSYSDPGISDTHSLYIDWDNNGTYEQSQTVSGGTFFVTRQYADDNPTATPSDSYNVNVKLVDDDTGSATANATITVNNAAPSLYISLLPASVFEGQSAILSGSYTDPGISDTHTLYIDWDNNGTYDQTQAVSGGIFSFSPQYPDDNPTGTPSDIYNVSVKLVDDDTGTATASASVTVNNVAPSLSVSFSPSSINEGQSATLTGTYTDPGVSDTHTLYIDWDNNGTYNQSQSVSGGTFSFTHLFVDDHPNTGTPSDTLTVGVKLEDDDTGSTSASPTIVVNNLDPSLSISLADDVIDESETATLNGTYTDPGISDTHSLYIDWDGDSTYDQNESVSGGTFTFTHHYGPISPYEVDFYKIIAELEDDDTGSNTASTTLAIYAQPDIDTDSNNDGTIDPDDSLSGTDDPIEETLPGRRIKVNLDDDNSNSTQDLNETSVSGENDLAEVLLDINADTSGPTTTHTFEAALTFGSGVIKLWDSSQKDNQITAGTTWNLLTTAVPTTVWAEGISLGYETVTLELRVNSAVVKYDKIVLTVDPHVCTLRAAIMESNHDADHDTVTFDIGGNNVGFNPNFIVNSTGDEPDNNVGDGLCSVNGPKEQHMADGVPTIRPQSPLPGISQQITIDGGGVAAIQVDGSGAGGDGFMISANSSTIKGLAINRFAANGIIINSNTNKIFNNHIGTGPAGNETYGNGGHGITIIDSTGNRIGNDGRNVISGNGADGIQVSGGGSTGNEIVGNYIGTNSSGGTALPNNNGVFITNTASTNKVNGNVISGNSANGVYINGSNTNTVSANRIGVVSDQWEINPLPNGQNGVLIDAGAQSNRIESGNTISGNKLNGVHITGAGTESNVVDGNYIGTDSNNVNNLANGKNGVQIDGGASKNKTVNGNVISGNTENGVFITGDGVLENKVTGNKIGVAGDGTTKLENGKSGVLIYNGPQKNEVADNTISGNKEYGVWIYGEKTNENKVTGNKIGVAADGKTKVANESGVLIGGGSQKNEVSGNTISGNNKYGVWIYGDKTNENKVSGNKVGTDSTGNKQVANDIDGVIINSKAQLNEVDGNTISGNKRYGVYILDEGTNKNKITNNKIGTKADGLARLEGDISNGESGLVIASGAQENEVSSNTISGNVHYGVWISGDKTNKNTVNNNKIGVGSDDKTKVPNKLTGVYINQGAQENTIGSGNTISANLKNGVQISGDNTNKNVVTRNYIGTNTAGEKLGNTEQGVLIDAKAKENKIEGKNVISDNGKNGVMITGDGTDGNIVSQNYIGMKDGGNDVLPNIENGVAIEGGAKSNKVENENVISGNTWSGVRIDGANTQSNLIQNNLIGTDSSGDNDKGNLSDGILVRNGATLNTIEDNTISGNDKHGLQFTADTAPATKNYVYNNKIGVNKGATKALANKFDGVVLDGGASNHVIGVAGKGNVISGNGRYGVTITGSTTADNKVQANFIGTKSDKSTKLGNGEHGVYINGASLTRIGGTGAKEGNTIANNGGDGVFVPSGTGNPILSNEIHSNTGLGIDLTADGPTANDDGDGDGGGNNTQNFPVFTKLDAGTMHGLLHSAANKTYRIEIFEADADASGFGEGKTFVTNKTVTTGADGKATFTFAAAGGTEYSATATVDDSGTYGDTSEFSPRAVLVDVNVHASDKTETFETLSAAAPATNPLLHFVSSRKQNDMVLEAELSPNTAAFRNMLTWQTKVAGVTLTSPAVGTDKGTVKLDTNMATGKKIPIQIYIAGTQVSEVVAWVVSASLKTHTVTTTKVIDATSTDLGANAAFSFKIEPAEIITDADRPNLAGARGSAPPEIPGGFPNVWNPGFALAGGADQRWDVSRQLRMKTDNPAGLLPGAGAQLSTKVTFPHDEATMAVREFIGNDDKGVIDEHNNPYAGGTVGEISSTDGPHVQLLHSKGAVGDTLVRRVQFEEFARLSLGAGADARWFRISDFHAWRSHTFHRKTAEGGTVDLNGDGDMVDDVWIDDGNKTVGDESHADWPAPLFAEGFGTGTAGGEELTDAKVAAAFDLAKQNWALAGMPSTALDAVKIHVEDLSGTVLGQALGDTVWIDRDAAGHGWRIDTTADTDSVGDHHHRLDLLTVLTHELGHLLGLPDLDPDSHPGHIMSGTLPAAEMRLPILGSFDSSGGLLAGNRPSDDALTNSPAVISRFRESNALAGFTLRGLEEDRFGRLESDLLSTLAIGRRESKIDSVQADKDSLRQDWLPDIDARLGPARRDFDWLAKTEDDDADHHDDKDDDEGDLVTLEDALVEMLAEDRAG